MTLTRWALTILGAAGVLGIMGAVRTVPAPADAQSYRGYTTAVPYVLTPALTAVSTPQIPANTRRTYLRCSNDSDTVIYLSVNATPALSSGVRLNASGGVVEWSDQQGTLSQASVSAITSAGGKTLMCLEGSQ